MSAGRGHRQGDSCGCEMGARFLGATLALSTIWYGWHWRSSGLSLGSSALRVMLLSFGAALVGKIVGILLFQYRSRPGIVGAADSNVPPATH